MTTAEKDMENTKDADTVGIESTALFDLIYDIELKRPACVLLQAAYGCGASPQALRYFGAESWLVAPTKGMRRISCTKDEWKQIAARFCGANAR